MIISETLFEFSCNFKFLLTCILVLLVIEDFTILETVYYFAQQWCTFHTLSIYGFENMSQSLLLFLFIIDEFNDALSQFNFDGNIPSRFVFFEPYVIICSLLFEKINFWKIIGLNKQKNHNFDHRRNPFWLFVGIFWLQQGFKIVVFCLFKQKCFKNLLFSNKRRLISLQMWVKIG